MPAACSKSTAGRCQLRRCRLARRDGVGGATARPSTTYGCAVVTDYSPESLIIPVKLSSTCIHALVDFGASVNLVKKDLKNSENVIRKKVALYTATYESQYCAFAYRTPAAVSCCG